MLNAARWLFAERKNSESANKMKSKETVGDPCEKIHHMLQKENKDLS